MTQPKQKTDGSSIVKPPSEAESRRKSIFHVDEIDDENEDDVIDNKQTIL